jgi:hypothetical protein
MRRWRVSVEYLKDDPILKPLIPKLEQSSIESWNARVCPAPQ